MTKYPSFKIVTCPPILQKGDKIAITATARKLLLTDIKTGIEAIEHFGYTPVVSESVGAAHYIFAGTDDLRADELQSYLDDATIKAIWLARGGYGTIRILENLNWEAYKKNPKWLIGFSDVTNLLCMSNDIGIACMHGPMPKTIPFNFEDDISTNTIFSYLKGDKVNYTWNTTRNCKKLEAKGKIIGGNLATLSHIYPFLDKDFFLNKILFIEEIDEYIYQIDRMLRGMSLSGRLDNLEAIIVGDFSEVKDNDPAFGESVEEVFHNVFNHLDIPIAFGFKAGHEAINWPLVFGKEYELKCHGQNWKLH